MIENIYYNTGLKDSKKNKINIGCRLRINNWDYGTVYFDDGNYFIKVFGKNKVIKITKEFLKNNTLEVFVRK